MLFSKVLFFFGTGFACLSLSACSGGGSGVAGPGPASSDMRGKLEVTDNGGVDAQEQLAKWQAECEDVQDYSKTALRKGLVIESRSDDIWKSYDPKEDWNSASLSVDTVTSVKSPNEFYVTNRTGMVGSNLQVTAEFQYTIENGNEGSRRTKIISTSPPELKDQLEKTGEQQSQYGTSCTGESDPNSVSSSQSSWATMTLASGQVVRGILTIYRSQHLNYTCRQIDLKTGRPISSRKIADRVTETHSFFVTTEMVNPLTSKCASRNNFLRSYLVQADSGEIIQLSKEEVTSFK